MEDFKIQAYPIKDLPAYITYAILKIIQSNSVVFDTFHKLMTVNITDADGNWFTEVCANTNMTLHDLIGHMKRSNDSGEIRTKLGTIVDMIRQSHLYKLEKRIEALELKE